MTKLYKDDFYGMKVSNVIETVTKDDRTLTLSVEVNVFTNGLKYVVNLTENGETIEFGSERTLDSGLIDFRAAISQLKMDS